MGDPLNEGLPDELPLHRVQVSDFHLSRMEVTKAEWNEVSAWAVSRGYSDLGAGEGKGDHHPVHTVNWWDAVKYCNARSEKEGFTPVYTVHDAVLRHGNITPTVRWTVNGYRLPTEAEWEKAARGGLNGRRFPWGATISHDQANYNSDSSYLYDVSPTRNYHPKYATGSFPYTSPVGSFTANGYGLHDMIGNVFEWCWDWYGATYYRSSPETDPTGPESGVNRVIRGGIWFHQAFLCRTAARDREDPSCTSASAGFRVARSTMT